VRAEGKWLGIYHLREKEKGKSGKGEEIKVWHGFTFGLGGQSPSGEKLPPLEAAPYSIVVKSLRAATSQKTGKTIKVLERKRTIFATALP
jgi:hypothetical protein